MNNSIYFILILLAGISCSDPKMEKDISEVYESLLEQRQFYYNVEYNINNKNEEASSSLYGTVSLNRDAISGISSGYFGLTKAQLSNYLHSIYFKNEWIHDLSSNVFDLNDADVLTDSLHSPILINPNILFEIQANSSEITKQRMNGDDIKWIFHLEKEEEQLVLVWNEKHEKLIELEYKYDVNTENTYSRKWSFDYFSNDEYNKLAEGYKHNIQIAHQPFL